MAFSAASPNLHNVFVYGTLMADDVVQILLKRVPSSSSATLVLLSISVSGYNILTLMPSAILPVESKKVTGKVLLGVTNLEIDVLDAFEDKQHERKTVEISLIDKSEKLSADTYVWGNKDDPDLYGEWDFEEWKRLHMKKSVAIIREFVKDYEQSEPKSRKAI